MRRNRRNELASAAVWLFAVVGLFLGPELAFHSSL
jgi:hypothetical protein